jgi:hypothetical protein
LISSTFPINLSRMLIFLLALADGTAAQALAEYRARTAVAVECRARAEGDDVVVCARRAADRYRLPLVTTPDPGDPANEGVPAERERLLARTTQCQDMTPFLVGCGVAGASFSTARGFGLSGERPITP